MHLKRGPRAHAGNIHVLRDGAVLLRAETDKPEPRLAPSGRSSKAALRQGRLNTRAGRKLRVSGPAGGSECAWGGGGIKRDEAVIAMGIDGKYSFTRFLFLVGACQLAKCAPGPRRLSPNFPARWDAEKAPIHSGQTMGPILWPGGVGYLIFHRPHVGGRFLK
ncbi:hypothetical protein T492DRAFT_164781 [Pavlovales sp. CCMP2436]|nr:hypothetical protein T492DRAFT_164781 [Pavlovales sp. CCMP2436]